MEDINDEILIIEKERQAVQERLDNLLKTKAADAEEAAEINRQITKSERKIRTLTKKLNSLCDTAIDIATAVSCEVFCDDCFFD